MQNFEAIALNSTSVELTWAEPAEPNGNILFYNITGVGSLCDLNTFDQQVNCSPPGSDCFSTVISQLDEFENYTFEIEAVNSKGPGESNANTTEQTLSDGNTCNNNVFSVCFEFRISPIYISAPLPVTGLNATITNGSITLRWNQTDECDVNGVFLKYEMKYSFYDPLGDVENGTGTLIVLFPFVSN